MPRPTAPFAAPVVPQQPPTDGPAPNMRDDESVGLLLDESTRLRIQIAQRPSKRADLEEALLEICLTQAQHVQALQRQRERTLYEEEKHDDVYVQATLERQNKRINAEAATLVRLVRAYRLFVPTEQADPANYANLFNPFLDWLERSDAPDDLKKRTHNAVRAFVETLPRRADYPGAPAPTPEPYEGFVPLY